MTKLTVQMFAFNSAIAKELRERVTEAALREPFRKANGTEWVPSAYQQRFFDWVGKGHGSAILKAVAGSGKTTSIIASLSFIPGLTAENVSCKTFHSVGYYAVCKHLGKASHQVKPDGKKLRNIAKAAMSEDEYELYADFAVKLVAFGKGEGVGVLRPDNLETWASIVAHHDLYLDSFESQEDVAIQWARSILQKSNQMAKGFGTSDGQPYIDFDDQLYLPLLWKLRLWQNDWVFIDESQDTNPVRRALAKLSLRPGGRLVAVGDTRQAIYGFTGASADAMELIRREFSCVELPLTVSYRCPKAIAERVRGLVPYFETPDGAPEGAVRSLKLEEALKVLGPHDAILCRQTAPLLETAFRLISKGVGCAVLGKDIGAGLVSLVKKMRAKGLEQLVEKLEAYRSREVAGFMAKGEEQKAEAVSDRVECVLTVLSNLDERSRTVPALIAKIEGMFSDANGVLTLATVHKVKGKEYRNVAILRPDLMPSKWARQEWQQEQEVNLQYVAWTRTMDTLMELAG